MIEWPSADMTLICPSCSALNHKDASVCTSCGAAFHATEPSPTEWSPTEATDAHDDAYEIPSWPTDHTATTHAVQPQVKAPEVAGSHYKDTSSWTAAVDAFFGTDVANAQMEIDEFAAPAEQVAEQVAIPPSAAIPAAPTERPTEVALIDAQSGGQIACPICGAANNISSPFCAQCGTELPLPVPPSHDAPAAAELVGPGGTVRELRGVMSLGRDQRNSIVVNDSSVSRVHCRIDVRADSVLLRDLHSTNGVWVNGRRVEHEELTDGDRILLGRTELVFKSLARSGH